MLAIQREGRQPFPRPYQSRSLPGVGFSRSMLYSLRQCFDSHPRLGGDVSQQRPSPSLPANHRNLSGLKRSPWRKEQFLGHGKQGRCQCERRWQKAVQLHSNDWGTFSLKEAKKWRIWRKLMEVLCLGGRRPMGGRPGPILPSFFSTRRCHLCHPTWERLLQGQGSSHPGRQHSGVGSLEERKCTKIHFGQTRTK